MSDTQVGTAKSTSEPVPENPGSRWTIVFEYSNGWRHTYYHPVLQVALLGLVFFMSSGMFNALTGLGGGGQVNTTDQADANSALYATFAVFGFFSGTINNILGPRLTLMLGTWGYSLYIASFLVVNIYPGTGLFVVSAGAVLGICASLLWAAQGSLIMAYPTEAQKGLFIGIFWAIYNMGGVVGSAVSFGQNFNSTASSVGNATYIGFLVPSVIGIVIPIIMANPFNMVRTDGSKVIRTSRPSWKTELVSLLLALKEDPWILLLFPMFFGSNYTYPWEFNDYNAAIFTIRARGLNNLAYWTAQIFGSLFIGHVILDQKRYRRRVRAFAGWVLVFIMIFVVNTWAYFYQRTYTRQSVVTMTLIDIYNSDYPAHVWLMIFFGFFDSMWQTYVFWLMGAMSNDMNKLSVYAGFYNSLQACGSAIVWRADATATPYMNIFLSMWAVLVAGMVSALPMVYYRVRDHTESDSEGPQVEGPNKA